MQELNEKGKDIMLKFHIGQHVQLASNAQIIFQITGINIDHTFQIQMKCSEQNHLKYDNVSAEMLRKVAE